MPSVGVFAVLFDDERRICCVRLTYAHRGWTTPGGRVEPGESPVAALKREVYEETGYSVEIGRLVGVYSKPEQDDIILSFQATATDCLEVSRSSSAEIAEVRFFPSEQLPVEMTGVTRQRIADSLKGLKGVYREFRGPEADERLASWPRDLKAAPE